MLFWKRIVRNYFTFNKRERRGIYVLITLLLGLITLHLSIRFYPTDPVQLSFRQLAVIDSVEEVLVEKSNSKEFNKRDYTSISWTEFDPNEVAAHVLTSLGLDETLAERILNYRSKGGRFRKPTDMLKIYGMDELWFDEAEKYIKIADRFHSRKIAKDSVSWNKTDTTEKKSMPIVRKFELNSVDSVTLDSVPWVGAFTAGEIISLRNRYHGFRSYDQLVDVYRISDEAIENIMRYSTLDTGLVQYIDLNHCDLRTLGRHPYLTWKQAKIILNYREQHGPYSTVQGILKTSVISDSVYSKIAPYLTVAR